MVDGLCNPDGSGFNACVCLLVSPFRGKGGRGFPICQQIAPTQSCNTHGFCTGFYRCLFRGERRTLDSDQASL